MLTKVLDNDPLKGTHVQGFQWAPTTDQKASATLLGEVGYSFLRNWGWEWRLSKNDSDKTLIKAVIRLKKDTFYHHFNTLLISIKKLKNTTVDKNSCYFLLLLNLMHRMLKIAFYGFQRFQNFLGEHAARLPWEERGRQPFFDTVGYPIQTCWLLQLLLKPCMSQKCFQ